MSRLTVLIFAALFVTDAALASGDRITQSNDNNAQTTGDVSNSIGGDDGIAIGYGPDNDINECMAHWSAVVMTFPTRNKFCQRLELVRWAERPETHTEASVRIMCAGKMAREVFGGSAECETVFTPAEPEPEPKPEPETADDELADLRASIHALEQEQQRQRERQEREQAAQRRRAAAIAEQQQIEQKATEDLLTRYRSVAGDGA